MTANRIWIYGGIALMFIVFLVAMTSGVVLKKPLTGKDNVLEQVQKIKQDINNNHWDTAQNDALKLNKAWHTVRTRILISSEKDDIKKIDERVESVMADVETKDKSSAFRQLNLIKDGFRELE